MSDAQDTEDCFESAKNCIEDVEDAVKCVQNKKKRGRKGQIAVEEQFIVYRNNQNEILDEHGTIRPASAEIYRSMSNNFGGKMTAKAIHVAICKNSEEIFGSKCIKTSKRVYLDIESSDIEDDIEVISRDYSGATISCDLTENERLSLNLVLIKGPTRNYWTLRPGWADTIFSIVVRKTNTKCCFNFRAREIIGVEFKANAVCDECKGTLSVQSADERAKLNIQIVEGSQPHTFVKRRRLAKDKARSLSADLNNDSVHNVHTKLVNELSDDIDSIPRDFPTTKSLENLKYRKNANEESAITELRKMKYSPAFSNTLKEICTDPFRIMFWTQAEVYAFFQIKKRQRVCLSFDATGGLISRASILQDIKHHFETVPYIPHVFLYLLCLKNKNGMSIPVGQMLSSEQDSTTISMFLNKWLDDFSIPNEVVCDDSAALHKAVVRSFTRFRSVDDYLNACFMILEGKNMEIPECYLRLDVPHYIKKLTSADIFKKIDKRVKHYYSSVVGVIMQCESYDSIKSMLKDVLVLAKYSIFGEWKGSTLPTGEAMKSIDALIQTHEINFSVGDEIDESVLNEETESLVRNGNLKWFDDMINDIESDLKVRKLSSDVKSKSTNTNWYYFPPIIGFLRTRLSDLPLWSSVMRKYFDSEHLTGISTDIESRFNVLKNNVFRNTRLPVRADTFVRKFTDEVNCIAKMSRLLCAKDDANNNHQPNEDIPVEIVNYSMNANDEEVRNLN